jgi:hypothetical protein
VVGIKKYKKIKLNEFKRISIYYIEKMGVSYQENKKHIIKWRQTHREQFNEYDRLYKKSKYVSRFTYDYEHICRVFRAIRI